MKLRIFLILFATLLWPHLLKAETLTFGIVPQQSAGKLARLWTPILSYLNRESGVNLQFATAKDIPTFEKRVAEGRYDIAYMNPYHYTVFSQKPGYSAFAHQKNKKIKGIVVVPKDSSINSLTELTGSTLAFPSPAAFAASLLPQAKLRLDNINFQSKYVSSHDSVYLSVSKGLFPAGGGVMRTFNNTDPEVRSKLRILWTTNPYTPHAFASHPNLSSEVVDRILKALVKMNNNPEGMALLKSINFKGIESAEDSNWNDVRNLKIPVLVDM